MSVLDDLYNVKIYPFEQIVSTDKNYRPVNTKVGEMRDYFMEKLPPDDREKFSQWNRLIHEIDYMDSYANFVYKFRLGFLLCFETLTGFELPEE